MAKMRVHELAKELNIKSQEIIDALSTTEYAVKSASSGLEDDAQKVVRSKFIKKDDAPKAAPKAEEKAASAPKAEEKKSTPKTEEKKAEDGKERPKKKSSISAVFNAQYSKQSRRPGQGGNGNNRGNNRGPRKDRDNNGSRPEQHSIIRPRPVGERAMRPISERTANNADEFEQTRPAKAQGSDKPRQQNNNRPNDRNDRNNRPNGERNDRGNRPSGDRNDRGNRPNGDRNDRGNRNGFGGNRPSGDRNDRNNRGGDRNDRNNRGRLDKEINRFNKESAAAAPDDVRGKESRSNDRRNNNNNRRQEHDKLGGKRQENYVNLEKHGGKKKPQQQPQKPKEDEDVIKTITLPEKMTIRELADHMKVQPSVIVKKLFMKGQMVTVNQEVDFDAAEEIALEFNYICEPEEKVDVIAELLKEDEENPEDMVARPPVVCVMGHVDHGKTSLLDAIRKTNVTAGEAGGITQAIGAYQVKVNDSLITFLDTPGHEAFTSMRARGANMTDIAVLVVAADDGIMPQTIESINHAKAANVKLIVAMNKMDKPTANPERVMEGLTKYGIITEDWGGDVACIPVSALTGMGINDLLERIALEAEVMELKANPNRRAKGAVVEARLDKGQGPIATILVQNGTLHSGDVIIAGTAVGRVRTMRSDKGQLLNDAGPSTPVEITGLTAVPEAGDLFEAVEDERLARELAEQRVAAAKEKQFSSFQKVTLDNLFSQMAQNDMKELAIVVKADVQGSAEAVKQSLEKISNEEVRVRVIHAGVGAISKSDVDLADASNAIIIGFNVRPDNVAKEEAAATKVEMRMYRVIYDAINDVTDAMKGMLAPKFREVSLGELQVRQVYKISNVGTVAGCRVTSGKITRDSKVRVVRDGIVITEDEIASLKRFKDDVKEVAEGYECGVTLAKFADVKEGDVYEAFKMEEYRD